MLKKKTKILLVDDHRLFLEGLRHLLLDIDGGAELDMAYDVGAAIHKIDQNERFQLIIADLNMPTMDGFSFLIALNQRNIVIPTVIISSTCELSDITRAIELGALGFVHKNASSTEMLMAINHVLSGKIYLPDDVWPLLKNYPHVKRPKQDGLVETKDNEVGSRQLEVLDLIISGLSNSQIASVLDISESTVKYHVSILFKHFGVVSRTALIKCATSNSVSIDEKNQTINNSLT